MRRLQSGRISNAFALRDSAFVVMAGTGLWVDQRYDRCVQLSSHGVVAKEFSRMMRPDNFKDYSLLQAFVDSGTVLYLPDGPLDLASAMGGLMAMIRAGMARIERWEILTRMNADNRFAPPGSSRGSGRGDEAAEAFDGKGRGGDLANVPAVT